MSDHQNPETRNNFKTPGPRPKAETKKATFILGFNNGINHGLIATTQSQLAPRSPTPRAKHPLPPPPPNNQGVPSNRKGTRLESAQSAVMANQNKTPGVSSR